MNGLQTLLTQSMDKLQGFVHKEVISRKEMKGKLRIMFSEQMKNPSVIPDPGLAVPLH